MGKTLGEIYAMPQSELVAWREFYTRWPFDDLHRFHRPAALVSVSLNGGDFNERLSLLQPPIESSQDRLGVFGLFER